MKRLTSDNIFEMNMHQLALNQVYISEGGWTQYVEGPDCECSVCDLVRAVSETLGVELPILSDEALSDLMLDWLQYGAEEPEGVVAILYRALCAMAEVRDRLFRYEDTGLGPEEVVQVKLTLMGQVLAEIKELDGVPADRMIELAKAEKDGRLVVLPFREADYIYRVVDMRSHSAYNDFVSCQRVVPFGIPFESSFGGVGIIPIEQFGKTAFLTREEAETALKKRVDGCRKPEEGTK